MQNNVDGNDKGGEQQGSEHADVLFVEYCKDVLEAPNKLMDFDSFKTWLYTEKNSDRFKTWLYTIANVFPMGSNKNEPDRYVSGMVDRILSSPEKESVCRKLKQILDLSIILRTAYNKSMSLIQSRPGICLEYIDKFVSKITITYLRAITVILKKLSFIVIHRRNSRWMDFHRELYMCHTQLLCPLRPGDDASSLDHPVMSEQNIYSELGQLTEMMGEFDVALNLHDCSECRYIQMEILCETVKSTAQTFFCFDSLFPRHFNEKITNNIIEYFCKLEHIQRLKEQKTILEPLFEKVKALEKHHVRSISCQDVAADHEQKVLSVLIQKLRLWRESIMNIQIFVMNSTRECVMIGLISEHTLNIWLKVIDERVHAVGVLFDYVNEVRAIIDRRLLDKEIIMSE